jgi:hypothetical protein
MSTIIILFMDQPITNKEVAYSYVISVKAKFWQ